MSFKANFKAFQKYAEQLASIDEKAIEQFCVDFLNATGGELLRKARQGTPVDKGTLNKGWKASAVETAGGGYEITIFNPVNYARYVEYGHRAGKDGWVKGKFMLTDAEIELKKGFEKALETKLRRFLKEKLQ